MRAADGLLGALLLLGGAYLLERSHPGALARVLKPRSSGELEEDHEEELEPTREEVAEAWGRGA